MASDATTKSKGNPPAEEEPTPGLAGLWARHGNKVLIGLTVALLIFWAVRYRQKQEVERQNLARDTLASAWVGIDQLRVFAAQPRSAEMDAQVSQAETQINSAVQTVLDDPKIDPVQAAWAWLARAEVYWALAQRPASTPTTAPTSGPASQPANDPLALARNAYEQVVNTFPADPTALTIARFGLAAVAEEKGDFATAREQYKKLIETPNFTSPPPTDNGPAAAPQISLAERRLERLSSLEKPTLLLPATQPTTKPVFLPELMNGGLTGPTGPQLPPVPPATAPSTRPATTQP